MAKSLKSKSKREFRAVKRKDPKSAFKIAEDLRLARLSAKLKQSALKPRALTDQEEYQRKQDGYETEEEQQEHESDKKDANDQDQVEATSMAVDGAEDPTTGQQKKVSTSGPRLSRRESYRTDKNFQVRMTPKTHFRARGEAKKMGCKPHRRR